MKKRISMFCILAILLFAFTACVNNSAEDTTEPTYTPASVYTPAAETAPEPTDIPSYDYATEYVPAQIVIYDREGFPVTLPSQIYRIISIGPSNTEILAELGLSGQIIATDTFSDNVPGIQPGISIFDMMALDLEYMIYLEPDIIFVTGMTRVGGEDPLSVVSDMGISVIHMPTSTSIADIKEDIRFMATVVGEVDKGDATVAEMTSEIDRIRAIGETITDRRTVYFEISPAPFMFSFGTGTFLHEMIELVGADNVFGDQMGWLGVSDEALLEINPDVILTSVNFLDDPIADIVERPGWSVITAVQNGDIFIIDTDASNRPSHHIVIALREIAEAVYPGKF